MRSAPLPNDLVWPRARVERLGPDGRVDIHRRVRFVIDRGTAVVLSGQAERLAMAKIADGSQTSTDRMMFTTVDGEQWAVEQRGCGCGSG